MNSEASGTGVITPKYQAGPHSRPLPAFVNIVSALAVSFYFLLVSVSSLILIDGVLGVVVCTWALFGFPVRLLVRFLSWVLRRWMTMFIGHFEYYSRVTILATGDAFRDGESAIVISNHRSWMDSIVMYSLSRQVQTHGDLKFFAKKSLLFVPVFGIAGAITDCVIFITRQINRAGKRMDRTFHKLTNPKRRWPFWMISYLEGTRRTRAKILASQDFAKKRDLKALNHILQPRTKGFINSVHALRGTATAVYDITIGYQETPDEKRDMTPTFLRTFLTSALSPRYIHVHQRRYDLALVPDEEEELKRWVYKLYEEKDELLATFEATGAFPGSPQAWERMNLAYFVTSSVGYWIINAALFWILRWGWIRLTAA